MGASSSVTPLLWMKLQGTVTDLWQNRKPGMLSCFSFRVTRMCERCMPQINPHPYLKGLCVRVFVMVSLVEGWRLPGFLSVGDHKRNVLIISSACEAVREQAGTGWVKKSHTAQHTYVSSRHVQANNIRFVGTHWKKILDNHTRMIFCGEGNSGGGRVWEWKERNLRIEPCIVYD